MVKHIFEIDNNAHKDLSKDIKSEEICKNQNLICLECYEEVKVDLIKDHVCYLIKYSDSFVNNDSGNS